MMTIDTIAMVYTIFAIAVAYGLFLLHDQDVNHRGLDGIDAMLRMMHLHNVLSGKPVKDCYLTVYINGRHYRATAVLTEDDWYCVYCVFERGAVVVFTKTRAEIIEALTDAYRGLEKESTK